MAVPFKYIIRSLCRVTGLMIVLLSWIIVVVWKCLVWFRLGFDQLYDLQGADGVITTFSEFHAVFGMRNCHKCTGVFRVDLA